MVAAIYGHMSVDTAETEALAAVRALDERACNWRSGGDGDARVELDLAVSELPIALQFLGKSRDAREAQCRCFVGARAPFSAAGVVRLGVRAHRALLRFDTIELCAEHCAAMTRALTAHREIRRLQASQAIAKALERIADALGAGPAPAVAEINRSLVSSAAARRGVAPDARAAAPPAEVGPGVAPAAARG